MKFLFFLAVVAAVFLWLRSLVLHQGSRKDSTAGQEGSNQASGPADSYANPYEPRDYDGGCRPQDVDGVGGSDSDSSSNGDGGGSDGGSGSD